MLPKGWQNDSQIGTKRRQNGANIVEKTCRKSCRFFARFWEPEWSPNGARLGCSRGMRVAAWGLNLELLRLTCLTRLHSNLNTALRPQGARRIQSLRAFRRPWLTIWVVGCLGGWLVGRLGGWVVRCLGGWMAEWLGAWRLGFSAIHLDFNVF